MIVSVIDLNVVIKVAVHEEWGDRYHTQQAHKKKFTIMNWSRYQVERIRNSNCTRSKR